MPKIAQDWWEAQNQKMQSDIKDMHKLLVQLKLQNNPVAKAAYTEVERQLNKINDDLRRHLQHKTINKVLETDKQDVKSLDNIWS